MSSVSYCCGQKRFVRRLKCFQCPFSSVQSYAVGRRSSVFQQECKNTGNIAVNDEIAFGGIDYMFFRLCTHKIYHVIHKVSWCSGYHISLTPKRSRVRSPPRSKRRYQPRQR